MPDTDDQLRALFVSTGRDEASVAAIVQAAREGSEGVGNLPPHEVLSRVDDLLGSLFAAYLGSADPAEGVAAAERLAGDRASQGVPLADLLAGWQSGRRRWMELIAERLGEGEADPRRLMTMLIDLDERINLLHDRLVLSYRAHELELTRTAQDLRTQALRELVTVGHSERLAETTLHPGRAYHCLLADVSDTRLARSLEGTLAGTEGLAGLVDGYLCCVTPRLPTTGRLTSDLLLVASPPVLLPRLGEVYPLVRATLDAARLRHLSGLHPVTQLALAVAADSNPRLGRMLADELLPGLDPGDAAHRVVAETARTFLANGSRGELAAAALHVHPNTVKYRLKRFAELTGFEAQPPSTDQVLDLWLRWWWALNVWLRDVPEG